MHLKKETKQKLKITKQELYEVYNAGKENCVLFMRLLIDKIEKLEEIINELQEKVRHLESKISKDSHNSNKPPSSDGMFQAPKSQRKKTGKSVGGQKGHKGTTLRVSRTPDKIEVINPEICDCCGISLKNENIVDYERRQVVDTPAPVASITEYAAGIAECPKCHTISKGKFPSYVTNRIQYGPNIRAFMMYFRHQNFIPTERLAEVISDIFNLKISEATIINTTCTLSDCLEDFESAIAEKIQEAPIIHCDETGIKINGKLHWLHSAGTPDLTAFLSHEKRGTIAMHDFGILPGYTGRVIHDGWQSYYKFECNHGLCNAHHLRELTFVHEELGQVWAGKMKRLLLKIKDEADMARSLNQQISIENIKKFESWYQAILRGGVRANPVEDNPAARKRGRKKKGKARCLIDRFRERYQDVLAFMYDTSVPFDNNLAERDIRMTKVHQKISGGFRSTRGAFDFCRIRGIISTVRKQEKNVLEFLVKVFENQANSFKLA